MPANGRWDLIRRLNFQLRGHPDFDSEMVVDKKKTLDVRSWLCCEYSKISLVTNLYDQLILLPILVYVFLHTLEFCKLIYFENFFEVQKR